MQSTEISNELFGEYNSLWKKIEAHLLCLFEVGETYTIDVGMLMGNPMQGYKYEEWELHPYENIEDGIVWNLSVRKYSRDDESDHYNPKISLWHACRLVEFGYRLKELGFLGDDEVDVSGYSCLKEGSAE